MMESVALDEPIRDTIRRDLMAMGKKFEYVCSPKSWSEEGGVLRQWDLWGPLILCLILSVSSWLKAEKSEKRAVFSFLYVFYWLGSWVVVANVSLLGGKISTFQALGVLGYCSFPLVIACVVALLVPQVLSLLKVFIVAAGVYMSTKAAVTYVKSTIPEDKFYIATYPLLLFFIIIAWITVVL
ncbi:Yip1 domain protein [Gregarina niphandrodes]|uniref:Protein YIPF n=1 Tax=Gregarina niphandrodes TaxID=110365 RepID=A0A023BDI7_GRENI|nr:Yip1 domain protein [Gregarina niphandrodes]EZG88386.1 Yip1 domain protein [Gregarina niphandrodes]|eukprot:XP_011128560.1 Yip1 domain protein [Gregarina niphandrodes]